MAEERSSSSGEGGGVILLKSLESSGVPIPPGVSTIKDLTPPTFFSICIHSLRRLLTTSPNPNPNHHQTLSFSFDDDEIYAEEKYYTSSSMPDRFNICSQLASAVSAIGFTSQITFHNFLYPSEEDFYKLLRFFVKKLSELPQHVNQVPGKVIHIDLKDTSSNNQTVKSANDQADLKAEEFLSTSEQDTLVNPDLPESSNFRSQVSSSEEVCYKTGPQGLEKLKRLKAVEQELEAVLSETEKREEELCKLLADVEIQPKVTSSRKSYVRRITEITKNSRKQDSDIERILKDTRELQLESNYIQERLNRTYAVVDETVFREGKKDPAGQQAYKLLTGLHESFQHISDKILSTDRIRREATEYEAKLSALGRKSFNVENLQADLDAIRRENEFLERSTRIPDDSGHPIKLERYREIL